METTPTQQPAEEESDVTKPNTLKNPPSRLGDSTPATALNPRSNLFPTRFKPKRLVQPVTVTMIIPVQTAFQTSNTSFFMKSFSTLAVNGKRQALCAPSPDS